MKSFSLIQPVRPARALVAALSPGLLAASPESATSPVTKPISPSQNLSLCWSQPHAFKSWDSNRSPDNSSI